MASARAGTTLASQAYGVTNNGDLGAENSWIMSPILIIPSPTFTLNFDSYTSTEGGFPTFYDVEWVEMSTDGGATWTAVHGQLADLHNFGDQTLRNITFALSATPGTPIRFRFRFDSCDGCCGPTDEVGWYLDNVNIFSGQPSTITWSPATGLDDPNIANPVASPTTTTTYSVTYFDGFGCTATDQVTVNVDPAPSANAGPDVSICAGESTQLNGVGTFALSVYSEDFESGNPGWTTGNEASTACGNTSIASTWGVSLTTGGTTPFNLGSAFYGTPNNGDLGAENSWIQSPPIAIPGADLVLSFDSYSSNEGGYPTFYDVEHVEYSTDGGATWTSFHAQTPDLHNFGDQTLRNITFSATVTPGTVVLLRWRFDSCDGCCGPTNIVGWYIDNVNVMSTANVSTVSWSPATDLSDPNIANPVASPTTTTTYTFTATDANGCTASDDVVVNVNPLPVVDAGSDVNVCNGCQTDTLSAGASAMYDFESGAQGWTTGNEATTACGNASIASGWAIGTVTGGLAPVTLGGSWFGNLNNGSLGAENSWIQSPSLAIPAGGVVTVNFDSYTSNESGYPTFYDVEHVEYSTDGGGTWTSFHGNLPDLHNFGDQTFRNITFTTTVAAGANILIRFRFDSCDGCCGPTDVIGWFVDNVSISAGQTLVGCTQLNATATPGGTGIAFADDFDPGIDAANWASIQLGAANNTCGNVSGANALHFNGAGQRSAETIDLNTQSGGNVDFELLISAGTNTGCENAVPGEEVVLEFSTDGGVTFTIINTYSTVGFDPFVSVSEPIPPAAQSNATRFRWRQLNNSGNNFDNWAIDDVSIGGGASIVGYSWSPTTGLSDPNVPDPIAAPATTTTYYVTATDGNGCTNVDSVTVRVIDISVDLTPSMFACGYNISCNGANDGTITASPADGDAPFVYTWSSSNPAPAGGWPNSATISNLMPGDYYVSVVDSNGCSGDSDTITLTEPPLLVTTGMASMFNCGFNI
ncbi:MAG: hypothetical protein AAF570_04195, partial [Bacteroidota bacterium]